MLKKLALLGTTVFGLTLAINPTVASAQDRYYGYEHRDYRGGDYHRDRDRDRDWNRHEWRERERRHDYDRWREHEWREHHRGSYGGSVYFYSTPSYGYGYGYNGGYGSGYYDDCR